MIHFNRRDVLRLLCIVYAQHVVWYVKCKYSLASLLSERQGHSLTLDFKIKKNTNLAGKEGSRFVLTACNFYFNLVQGECSVGHYFIDSCVQAIGRLPLCFSLGAQLDRFQLLI